MAQLWDSLNWRVYAAGFASTIVHRIPEYYIPPELYHKDSFCTLVKTGGRNQPRTKKRPVLGGSELEFDFLPTMRRDIGFAVNGSCRIRSAAGGIRSETYRLRALRERLPDQEVRIPAFGVDLLFYRIDGNFSYHSHYAIFNDLAKRHGRNTHDAYFADRFDAAIARADVVVANWGMHYNRNRNDDRGPAAYEAVVRHMVARLSTAASSSSKLAVAMESFVQHFGTLTGSGDYADRKAMPRCPKRCTPLGPAFSHVADWRNAILQRELEAELHRSGNETMGRLQLFPLAANMRPLHHLHKARRQQCQLDCLHICNHPKTVAVMTDGLFRRIVNWGETGGRARRPHRHAT